MVRRGVVTLTACLVLAACAAPGPEVSPTRAPELGAPASIAAETTPAEASSSPPTEVTAEQSATDAPAGQAATESTGGQPTGGAPEATTTGNEPDGTPDDDASAAPSEESAESEPEPTVVATGDDRTGDQGLEGPAYADLVGLRLLDDGRNLTVEVGLAAPVPTTLAEGEVIGLGIDLLRGEGGESRYQLFADGGDDGWFAYLQTPEGFVTYPGTLTLDGAVVRFLVPWSAIGSPSEGTASAFLDWSQQRPVLNAASADRLPDRGQLTFTR